MSSTCKKNRHLSTIFCLFILAITISCFANDSTDKSDESQLQPQVVSKLGLKFTCSVRLKNNWENDLYKAALYGEKGQNIDSYLAFTGMASNQSPHCRISRFDKNHSAETCTYDLEAEPTPTKLTEIRPIDLPPIKVSFLVRRDFERKDALDSKAWDVIQIYPRFYISDNQYIEQNRGGGGHIIHFDKSDINYEFEELNFENDKYSVNWRCYVRDKKFFDKMPHLREE